MYLYLWFPCHVCSVHFTDTCIVTCVSGISNCVLKHLNSFFLLILDLVQSQSDIQIICGNNSKVCVQFPGKTIFQEYLQDLARKTIIHAGILQNPSRAFKDLANVLQWCPLVRNLVISCKNLQESCGILQDRIFWEVKNNFYKSSFLLFIH